MSRPSNVVPGGDSKKTPTYNRYRFKTNFQPKTLTKFSPYFADPRIVPRVRQYLEENKDKYFIDFYDMVDQLQRKYKEYGRRKRSDFKSLVEKAFSVVLESYEKKGEIQGGDDSSSDISDMEMVTETTLEDNNVAKQQMMNLYARDGSRNPTPAAGTEEEKVIDLTSSDESEIEVSEDPRPKRFKQNNSSAAQVQVITSVPTPNVPVVNEDVTVTVRPTLVRKNVPKEESVEVNNTHKQVAMDTRPATVGPKVVSPPSSTQTPMSTPATVATPATTRLNQSSRKRSRNTHVSTETADLQKESAKPEAKQTDLPVRTPNYTFEDVGGCTKVLQEVCKLLVHIRHPEIYAQVGVSPPRGFLLHGPPGCGKTLLAGAIAGELKIPLLKVSGPELIAGVSGESEERIRSLFDQAASIAPCVLFIDEVDAICPNRSTAQREMERRIVAQLLSCLDDLGERENGNRVLVVGATNRPDSLDPALRRAGRFDREVCLGIPDRAARAKILKVVCKNLSLDPEVASDEGMDYLASLTPGFVGADLKALTREAAMVAINRIFNTLQKGEPEEVEMIEETGEATIQNGATEEKVMEVENGEVGDEVPVQVEVPVAAEAPTETVVIEVNEVRDEANEIPEEDVVNVIVEEAEVTIEDTVVDSEINVDVETVSDSINPERTSIDGSVNGAPEIRDEVEVVTTEVVDLDITEESQPESQVSEDSRMTITIETPDGESQTIPAHPLPSENVVSDAGQPEPQVQVQPEIIPEIPQIVTAPDGEVQVVQPEVPEVVPQASDVPSQVIVPEVLAEIPPHVVITEGVPQIVPEDLSQIASEVSVTVPETLILPTETVPQVAPVEGEVKANDDAVMVVEEVEGMALSQQVPGTDCSAELNELLLWLRDSPPLTADQLNGLNVNLNDFREALHHVQPSAKREGFATVPDVTWDDVGSLASVRAELQLAILAPVRYPDQFERLGITSPTGVLLCGPPGCGKTLLAKAIANEAGVNFISVKGPELLNMYVGESERAVRQVFQRARSSAPCVIFFDELDSLCPRRSDHSEGNVSGRVVNQLLTEMDGVEGRTSVFLMAATNRPDILDPAVLRPGRLDKVLYVGLPKAADRFDILRALTKNGTKPALASDVDLSQIAQHASCEGYSGADLAALVREAGVQALREFVTSPADKQVVTPLAVASRHFAAAIAKIRPSVSEKDQKHYELLRKMYSSTGQRAEDTMDTT